MSLGDTPAGATAAEQAAALRLKKSRDRMARWLLGGRDSEPVDAASDSAGPGGCPRSGAWADEATGGASSAAASARRRARRKAQPSWLRQLRANPMAAICIDVLQEWWTQHPLQATARVAEVAARTALEPVARRHPIALVGTAAAAGALLVWARPWRWLLKPGLAAGIATQLTARLVSRLMDAQDNAQGQTPD
jgi:hypothetical protein